jgi:hypothetical protein
MNEKNDEALDKSLEQEVPNKEMVEEVDDHTKEFSEPTKVDPPGDIKPESPLDKSSAETVAEAAEDPVADLPSDEPPMEEEADLPPDEEDTVGSIEGENHGEVETRNALPVVGNPTEPLYTLGLEDDDGNVSLFAYAHGSSDRNAVRVYGQIFNNVTFRTPSFGWDPKIDGKKVVVIQGDAISQMEEA